MKNIHLIPTDKPSRFTIRKRTGELVYDVEPFTHDEYDVISNQNIYITSDEEISGFENDIWVIQGTRVFLWKNTMALVSNHKPKKIIIATDQDLIKDGVQAIDDEFLQWFVKNSSCERVEVKEKQHFEADKSKRINPLNGIYYSYKIIIPQEEPKQEETLEEIKDLEYWKNNAEEDYITTPISVLRYISQLEQEQDKNKYSEGEVLKFAVFYHGYKDLIKTEKWEVIEMTKEFLLKKWFEQFKKK